MTERDYIICTQLAHVRDAEAAMHGLIEIEGVVGETDLQGLRSRLRSLRLALERAVEREMAGTDGPP
jgi:hypothetical protein